MAEPTQQEISQFVLSVDEFMQNYARLISSDTQAKVYASQDPQLIADYEQARSRGATLKASVENTVGAWNTAKQIYATAIDKTSMYIGDAIDEIRSWFGGGPKADLGALGIIQFPAAAAWIAGIVGTAFILNNLMKKIFVRIETAALVESGIPRDQAIRIASRSIAPTFFQAMNIPLILGGALAVYLIWNANR